MFLGISAPIYIYIKAERMIIKTILTLVLLGAIPITWYMTSVFKIEYNENTVAHGYPIPIVIFQRDAPGGPWLDYVGPTTILAYPINYIAYIILPVLVLLITTIIISRRKIKQDRLS
jgi:hypothetical protein